MESNQVRTKLLKIFKGDEEEETKTDQPNFKYVTELLLGATLSDKDDKKVTAEDVLELFATAVSDLKSEETEDKLTGFMEKWISGNIFKDDEWVKACSTLIKSFE